MGIVSKLSALALLTLSLAGAGAAAQAPPPPPPDRQIIYPIDRLEQRDTDGDGRIDETRIHARIYTAADLITVIDGGGDMQVSDDWRIATDFRNDLWIFDAGAEGGAELLIDFQPDAQNRISANIYPDTTGDGVVTYRRDPDEGITVRESAIGTAASFRPTPPSIVLRVQDDWYLPDGTLNYTLTIFMDGSQLSLRDSSTYTMNFMALWDSFAELDGTPDQQYEVVDDNRDGIIDAVVWRLLAPTPSSTSAARSWLWQNVGQVRSLPPHDHFFFPYFSPHDSTLLARHPLYAELGAAQPYADLRYFDQPPGFEINWELARVTPVIFRGYPIEDGFHIGSNLNYVEPDIINYANFENQQAYYDLAGDDDNIPELHLRHRYFAAEDPYGWELPRAINEIRWSWNQANADGMQFDYKLSLGGRTVLDEVIEVGGYRLNVVPYDQFGGWILDQPWDIATFVVVEGRSYISSEGIYEWNAIEHEVGGWNGTVSAYLAGNLSIDLGSEHTVAPPLMRGEFVDPLTGAPQLYFSGVDGKLHLLHAEFCVWNVDGVREIRCDNLDGDPYFDYWYATNTPRPLPEVTSVSTFYGLNIEPYLPFPDQQLVLLDGYLLYADPNNVYLRAETIESAVFTVPPPYTTDGWRALDALLTEHQFDDPALSADLAALYNRFTAPDVRIKNARASEFRPDADGGIRFFLDVLPGFEVDNRLGLAVGDLSEGAYRVRVRDGVFTLDPLTPPDVRVALEYPFVEMPTFETVTTIPLNIVIENRGMTDVPVLRYRVFAQQTSAPDAAPRIVWDSVAAAPAESTVVLPIEWLPLDAGDWTVEVLLETVTVPSLDVLLADYTKLDNIGDIAALFPVAQAPLNPQGAAAITGSRTFTVVASALPASAFITLNGQQPLNGSLIIALLASVTILGVGIAVLVLRQTD